MKLKKRFLIPILFILLICSVNVISAQSNDTVGDINAEMGLEESDLLTDDQVIPDDEQVYNDVNESYMEDETPAKSFSELSGKINESSSVILNESYRFNSTSDSQFAGGITISRNMTVTGTNSCFIDGGNLSRMFIIDSNCSVVLKNLIFKNGFSKSCGGAIFLKPQSTLTLVNCTFQDNYAYNSDGGAIYAKNDTNILIESCEFINNTATRFSNKAWEDFKAGMGSAICTYLGSNLTVFNTLFANHTSYLTVILVISHLESPEETKLSRMFLKNCTFENNTSRSNGVIYLDELGQGEMDGCVFRNTVTTYYGGTVCMDASKSAIIRNCLFENNIGAKGGAIYIPRFYNNQSNVSIINCTLYNNTAEYGGAVFIKDAQVNITNTTFNKNYADISGGVIYANLGCLNISGCHFEGNWAQTGGALLLKNNTNNIFNSTFVKNTASGSGGAIYTPLGLINMSDSRFEGNSAQYGGALYLRSENTITNTSFIKNTASNTGGAIYLAVESNVLSDCEFKTNSAQTAGAIYSKAKTTIKGTSFTSNKASKNGGAIYSAENSITLTDSNFKSNSAQNGGALYLKASTSTIAKTGFEKNKATKNGGAIYATEKSIKITDSSFKSNSAQNGGAIYSKSKNTITKTSFTSNKASKKGKSIYSEMKTLTTSKCTYDKKSTPKGSDVYGAFNAKITQFKALSGNTKLSVKLSSIWKMPLSQKIKFTFSGYTSGWVKTDSKGKITIEIPKNVKVAKKYITITMENGVCYITSWLKKDPGIIKVAKTVKKSSKLKFTIKSKYTNKAIKKTKFTVKVYTKKKFKTFNVKTNSKGVFKISMKKFSEGTHKINVYYNDNTIYINKNMKIKIKK